MFKKLSLITVGMSTIWCLIACINGRPAAWPIVFIGLVPAVINLIYDCIQQWEREQLTRILEEHGMMEEIENLANRNAYRLNEILDDEDNEEED
jgi:hypothetical protein